MFESINIFKGKEKPKKPDALAEERLSALKKRRADLLEVVGNAREFSPADRVLRQKLDDEIAELEGRPEEK